MNYTYYIYGNLFGNLLLGLCLSSFALGCSLAAGLGVRGSAIGAAVMVVFVVIGYLPYDEVNQTVRRRAEEIEQTFPQLVSQMTLLVVAGMDVNRAWQISSKGGQTTLYEEMSRVNLDLENNVAPIDAYSKFITRCNNKYTTKLATAIMQNLSKGNSEIVNLFRQLNAESWSEYRHSARRMSEKVQTKLFVPTMLMFAGILILVILPVMSGFGF
jgi:tight adherence protein C